MKPILLPLLDFKKDFSFIWLLTAEFNYNTLDSSLLNFFTLFNPAALAYVSQLCQKIDLPEDVLETDKANIANLEWDVPKRVKMNDIVVTYLDDSINTVYNFHRAWFAAIRDGTSLEFKPLKSVCAKGTYITTEKNMSMTEYQNIFLNIPQTGVGLIDDLLEGISAKPTSTTYYPYIFPRSIRRSSADKGGRKLSQVIVTYGRIPDLRNRPKPFVKITNDTTLIRK